MTWFTARASWRPPASFARAAVPATLRANLLSAPGASDWQITGVLADLQLGPWLGQLDRSLGTVLASWGHPVSGVQRLSLARALLADLSELLLDEPPVISRRLRWMPCSRRS